LPLTDQTHFEGEKTNEKQWNESKRGRENMYRERKKRKGERVRTLVRGKY
jgi:hypothetical protein